MASKKRNAGIKTVIALVLIIAAAFGIYYMFFDKADIAEKETVNASVSEQLSVTESPVSDTQQTTSDVTSENSTTKAVTETTSEQAKHYELPLSINQAMLALEEHYGNEYDVNSTIEEDGINYFAVYKNSEKYASVAINLETGEATETITETNQKTDFYLV